MTAVFQPYNPYNKGFFPPQSGISRLFPAVFSRIFTRTARKSPFFTKTLKPGRQAGLTPFSAFLIHPVSDASLLPGASPSPPSPTGRITFPVRLRENRSGNPEKTIRHAPAYRTPTPPHAVRAISHRPFRRAGQALFSPAPAFRFG